MNVFCFCGDSDIVLGQCVQTIVDLNHDLPITKLDNKPKTFMFGTVYRNRQLWNPMMIYPKNTHKNQKYADLPYWNRQWGPHPPPKKKKLAKNLHLNSAFNRFKRPGSGHANLPKFCIDQIYCWTPAGKKKKIHRPIFNMNSPPPLHLRHW